MPYSAPYGQTSLESQFAGDAVSLECADLSALSKAATSCRTPIALLRHVALITALRIRAGDLCSQIGTRFEGRVVTGKAVGMISHFVVELQLLAIFGDDWKWFAVVTGLQVTCAAAFDRRRGGIFQHVSGENDISFR